MQYEAVAAPSQTDDWQRVKAIRVNCQGENTLELHVNLNPSNVVPFPSSGWGRPSSHSSLKPQTTEFPEWSNFEFELPVAAGAENEKGRLSIPTRRGAGEEKWPYIRIGRRDRI